MDAKRYTCVALVYWYTEFYVLELTATGPLVKILAPFLLCGGHMFASCSWISFLFFSPPLQSKNTQVTWIRDSVFLISSQVAVALQCFSDTCNYMNEWMLWQARGCGETALILTLCCFSVDAVFLPNAGMLSSWQRATCGLFKWAKVTFGGTGETSLWTVELSIFPMTDLNFFIIVMTGRSENSSSPGIRFVTSCLFFKTKRESACTTFLRTPEESDWRLLLLAVVLLKRQIPEH